MRQKCKQKVYSRENIILIVKSTQPGSQEICTSFTRCTRHFFVSSDSCNKFCLLKRIRPAHDKTLFQQSVERIIALLLTLSFQDHN